jgi:hypothetical protein
VKQHRVHPLDPGSVLHPQRMIGLQQRPALQHMRRRDPTLRQPPSGQQLPQMASIRPVGLGAPLGPRNAAVSAGSPRWAGGVEALTQPGRQVGPVRRRDLPPPQLPAVDVEVVEGDLLSVDVQSTDDADGTSSGSQGTLVPVRVWCIRNHGDALELRRSPIPQRGTRPRSTATAIAGTCHL